MPSIAATLAISGTLRAIASDESSTVARTSAFPRGLVVIKDCVGAWSLQKIRLHARPGPSLAHSSVSCARLQGLYGNIFNGRHWRQSGYILHVAELAAGVYFCLL